MVQTRFGVETSDIEPPTRNKKGLQRNRHTVATPEPHETPGAWPTPNTGRKPPPNLPPVREDEDTESESVLEAHTSEMGDERPDSVHSSELAEEQLQGENRGSGTPVPPIMEQFICQMMSQMANMNTINTASITTELDAEVREFLGDKYVDPNSQAGKLIHAFDERSKLIKKTLPLTGACTYPGWRENILHTAKILKIDSILLEKQKEPPSTNSVVIALWQHHNDWLYSFMDSSIQQSAKNHFKPPNTINAYELWEIVESTFAERPQITRKRLILEVSSMTSKTMEGDRVYIERLLGIRTELDRLGYPLPDYALFDHALSSLSKTYRAFLQDHVDQANRDDKDFPEKDLVGTLKDILARLPKTEQPRESSRTPANQTDTQSRERNNSGTTQFRTNRTPCSHCHSFTHRSEACWKKYPEQRPQWMKDQDANTNAQKPATLMSRYVARLTSKHTSTGGQLAAGGAQVAISDITLPAVAGTNHPPADMLQAE